MRTTTSTALALIAMGVTAVSVAHLAYPCIYGLTIRSWRTRRVLSLALTQIL